MYSEPQNAESRQGEANKLEFSLNREYTILLILPKSIALLNPPRIWWCPTGPLAFLPLHAAGIYSQNETSSPTSCISDYAGSSYTPTVSALLAKIKGNGNVRPVPPSKLAIASKQN